MTDQTHDPFSAALFPGYSDYATNGEQQISSLLQARVPNEDAPAKTLAQLDYSLPPKTVFAEPVFRDHEARLIKLIDGPHRAAVGCVAWLTSNPVLQALARLDAVTLIVAKEDFLRPDSGGANFRQLHEAYRKLQPFPLHELAPNYNYASAEDVTVSIVCAGAHNADKKPGWPRMHHKFLVLGDRVAARDYCGERAEFVPKVVWSGSFNFTYNATLSLENANIFHDEEWAEAYTNEFKAVLGISEPLDWNKAWVAPQFRIGT